MTRTVDSSVRRPLRLWPGVIVAVLIVLIRFVVAPLVPSLEIYGILAGVAGGAIIVLWWLFFSRAAWPERIGAVVLMIITAIATKFVVHDSIAGGFMGRMIFFYAVPTTLGPVFVAWAFATRHMPDRIRRVTMVAAILFGCGVWMLARTDGVIGDAGAQLRWRWSPTSEERLLAQEKDDPKPPAPVPTAPETPKEDTSVAAAEKPGEAATAPANAADRPAMSERKVARVEWPGFRGRERDAVVRGVRIESDWTKSPPSQVWRRPVGPGWSSFAVQGDLIYTQEQRGEHEVVSCYRLSTGEPVWRHRDAVRFYESNGGAGPRATPMLHNGRVYTHGATGVVNALDAASGSVVWTRNAANDTGAKLPGWGFAGSPVVAGDALIVAASGRLVAYDLATGNPRWTMKTRGGGYSSPHLATIDGVTQVLFLSGDGATSIDPRDGTVLWEHIWQDGAAIVQPAVIEGGDVLINSADAMGGQGMRRLHITRSASGWSVQERWTSRGLKPYFNDYVVHEGHAFGFDGTILSCIDIESGERKWKGGRYGNGQMVLLPEQDILLVVSEEGELALISATPDKFKELARFKAIEGKTWNHPVLVRDTLLVRNGEEMAAFRLAVAGR